MLNDRFICLPSCCSGRALSRLVRPKDHYPYIMKKFLLALIILSIFLPAYTLAAGSNLAPEFNPLCWKLDQCNRSRAMLLGKSVDEVKDLKDGWLENEDPCNTTGWGKCLPAGVTKTTIAFAGKKEFTDIGEFLKYNYKIALSIAGILAVIMIVVSGIQWVTSGGNSEMISSAKKRIGGAMIGLLIAYLSYTILNIVNPALVNLRLPQAYMVRGINTVPQFCKDVENSTSTKFAFAADKGVAVDKSAFGKAKPEIMNPNDMKCGKQYFVDGAGGLSCMGSTCDKQQELCLPVSVEGKNVTNQSSCVKFQMVVHYSIDASVEGYFKDKISWWTSTLEKDWLDDLAVFWGVCQAPNGDKYIGDKWERWGDDGEGMKIITVEKSAFTEYYLFIDNLNPFVSPNSGTSTDAGKITPAHDAAFWQCPSGLKLVGFVFKTEMSKTSVWFGGLDANFYSSPSGYVGGWKSISENGYITIDDLKKGLYFDAKLSTEMADYLASNNSTEPEKLALDGKKKSK